MRKLKKIVAAGLIGLSMTGSVVAPIISQTATVQAATTWETKKGILYKDGKAYTGTKDGKYYHAGEAFTGIRFVNNEYCAYYNGKQENWKIVRDKNGDFSSAIPAKYANNDDNVFKIIDKNGKVTKRTGAIRYSQYNGVKKLVVVRSKGTATYVTANLDGQKFSWSFPWMHEENKTDNHWIQTSKGNWYFVQNGTLVTGWKQMTKKEGEKTAHWSYFGKDGKLRTGWQEMGKGTSNSYNENTTKHWCYFGDNGWMRTGVQNMGKGTANSYKENTTAHVNDFGTNGWLVTNKTYTIKKVTSYRWQYVKNKKLFTSMSTGTSPVKLKVNADANGWLYFISK